MSKLIVLLDRFGGLSGDGNWRTLLLAGFSRRSFLRSQEHEVKLRVSGLGLKRSGLVVGGNCFGK